MDSFAVALFFLGVLALLGYCLRLASKRAWGRQDLLRLHLEARNRLLDRFGSAEAFLDFARTEEGQALLRPPTLPEPRSSAPAGLRLAQVGLVTFLASFACRASYAVQMNWRAANLHLDPSQEWMAWQNASLTWFWSQFLFWCGLALLLGAALAAFTALLGAALAAFAARRKA